MNITKKTGYALKALKAIVEAPTEVVSAKMISENENIPLPFLRKILEQLTKTKIIKVHRGLYGGYSINEESIDISLYDIIYGFEGSYQPLSKKIDTCNHLIKAELCRIDEITRDELKRKRLLELL